MFHNLITISAAADILGVSVETLRSWDKQGLLPAARDQKNRYRMYKVADLETFAARHGRKRKTRLKLTD